ncbi:unnamed protein product [Coffea canephora]|uniref:C2 tensin-type domain-containing protein n=1 Tax=Coffea canephora TaxID=49390 RepID=A0A068UB77_COFCA|nr:unnamed protein product [Coffea canephora]
MSAGVLFSTKKHPKTKDLMPEDFWLRAAKKGIVVFALPGEPGLTELAGDFKIHFQDRQEDFYCWLNTTMMENRVLSDSSDLDGFDKVNQMLLFVYKQTLNYKSFIFLIFSFHFFQDLGKKFGIFFKKKLAWLRELGSQLFQKAVSPAAIEFFKKKNFFVRQQCQR